MALLVLLVGSAGATPALADTECGRAFQAWTDGAASLNDPGTDIVGGVVGQESAQRRVFELCTVDEAEEFNRALGVVEPDFRTFAEVECADEAPFFSGTRVCADVAR